MAGRAKAAAPTQPGNPNATGESSNPQTGENGNGGIGVGGNIVNRRGGKGGVGSHNSSSGQGGGGSAPNPDEIKGRASGREPGRNYGAGSGASINFEGTTPDTSYTSRRSRNCRDHSSAKTPGLAITTTARWRSWFLGSGGRGGGTFHYSNKRHLPQPVMGTAWCYLDAESNLAWRRRRRRWLR